MTRTEVLNADSLMMRARLSKSDLRSIKRRIEYVKSIDLKKASVEFLKDNLLDLLEMYTSATILINDDRSIYRARKNQGTELFENISDVWYPRPEYIKRLNRANNIRQPVFYCCPDDENPILELRPDIGDVVTVLECKPAPKRSPLLISIGIYQLAKEHGVKIAGDSLDTDQAVMAWLDDNLKHFQKNKLIDEFVSNEFKKIVDEGDEYKHKITIAIAEILFGFEGIDGIAYPSIASGLRNANIALLPRAVDSIYKPIACQVVKVIEKKGDSGLTVSIAKAKSIAKSGRIEW